MGMFSKPKVQKVYDSSETNAADKESEVAKKQRLLETEGANRGAQIAGNQGQTIRRIFG